MSVVVQEALRQPALAGTLNSTLDPIGRDPLGIISGSVVSQFRAHGCREVEIQFEHDLDGDFRLDLESAFSADGLLPFIVRRAAKNRKTADWPLDVEADEEALLGERVVWHPCGVATLSDALSLVNIAVEEIIAANRGSHEEEVISLSALLDD